MTDIADAERLDIIRGNSYLAVNVAVQELRRRGLDVLGYTISVTKEGSSIFVVFTDEKQPPDVLGSQGKPGFEVELDMHLKVIRSNFVK